MNSISQLKANNRLLKRPKRENSLLLFSYFIHLFVEILNTSFDNNFSIIIPEFNSLSVCLSLFLYECLNDFCSADELVFPLSLRCTVFGTARSYAEGTARTGQPMVSQLSSEKPLSVYIQKYQKSHSIP